MNKQEVTVKQLCNLAFYPNLTRSGFDVLGEIRLPSNNYVFFEGPLKDGYFQLLNGHPGPDYPITNEGIALAPYYSGHGVRPEAGVSQKPALGETLKGFDPEIQFRWSLSDVNAELNIYYLKSGSDQIVPLVDKKGNFSVYYPSRGTAIFKVPTVIGANRQLTAR